MTRFVPSSLLAGLGLAALFAIACVMMIDPAFAQAAAGAGASFSCSGGHASGTLYDSGVSCPTTLKMSNVFSFLVCNMERLSSNLMGEMYCGIMHDLTPAVTAILTLAVLFFGMGFTIGVIPATARDFQLFLLKIVFVFVFATQSDYLIGTVYSILITGLREGTALGISAMFEEPGIKSGLDVYTYLDRFFGQALHYATDYVGAKWDGSTNPCQNAIFAVMAIMAVAFPPIFYIAIIIIFRVSITFLRAVFGYLYSLIGIVFLLTLAPIFLSFYMFTITRRFFDKWVGYLVSFTLQMVILFAFLGFIFSIKVDHVSSSLVGIVMPVEQHIETSTLRAPWKYCTICEFDVVDKSGNVIADYGAGDMIKEGKLVCKNPKKPVKVTEGMAPEDPKAGKAIQGALIKFAATGLLSLLVLAYLVEYLLNYVPSLAAFLASGLGGSAPQLGGGKAFGQRIAMDMPGGELINTFERGFSDGYQRDMSRTTVVSVAEGFKKATERLVLGSGPSRRADGSPGDYGEGAALADRDRPDPGLTQTFANFILNPNRDTYTY